MKKQEIEELKKLTLELFEMAMGMKKDPVKVALATQHMMDKLDTIPVED